MFGLPTRELRFETFRMRRVYGLCTPEGRAESAARSVAPVFGVVTEPPPSPQQLVERWSADNSADNGTVPMNPKDPSFFFSCSLACD